MKFGRIRDGTLFVLSMVALTLVAFLAYQSVVMGLNIVRQNTPLVTLASPIEFAVSTDASEESVAMVGKKSMVRQAEFAIAMNLSENPFNAVANAIESQAGATLYLNPFNDLAAANIKMNDPASATLYLSLRAQLNPFNDYAMINTRTGDKHKEAFPDGMTYRINTLTMVLSIS